jgi:hypothetical protein
MAYKTTIENTTVRSPQAKKMIYQEWAGYKEQETATYLIGMHGIGVDVTETVREETSNLWEG